MKFLKYVTALLCVTPICVQAMNFMEHHNQMMQQHRQMVQGAASMHVMHQQSFANNFPQSSASFSSPQAPAFASSMPQQTFASAPGPQHQTMDTDNMDHSTMKKRAGNLCCSPCTTCCCLVCCCPCTGCCATTYVCCNDPLTRFCVKQVHEMTTSLSN